MNMELVVDVAYVMLAIGIGVTLIRLVTGPTIADRVVATDLILTYLVIGTAVSAARSGDGTYLIVMLVVAVVGFLGTAMVARFIERRGV